MECFICSSQFIGKSKFNPANGFLWRLMLPPMASVTIIVANPDDYKKANEYTRRVTKALEREGFTLGSVETIDHRTTHFSISRTDLLFLIGGHVPTQNRYFKEIELKERLEYFDGILIGMSAGAMNCASTVYAIPELDGETSKEYEWFLDGLGLTDKMILPHAEELKIETIDGKRAIEDIAVPDSMNRRFYLFPDGTYLHILDGAEEICGEYEVIEDGRILPGWTEVVS